MLSRVKIISACIASASLVPAFAAAYEDGVQQYRQGHYQEASLAFARAESGDPLNATAHYYLANSFVYLKRHRQAIDEYRTSYALAQPGVLSQYCQEALNSYRQPLPDQLQVKRIRDTAYSAARIAAAEPAENRKEPPQIERSMSIIRRQAESEKRNQESISEATAQGTITCAQKAVKSVQDEAEQQVQKLYAPQPRRLAYSGDLRAREVQIRTQAREEEEWLLRQAQSKADHYRLAAEMHKSALDQVADNLEQQLADDGTRSGIKLVPAGTNLYVRTYASVRPARSMADAQAAVAGVYAEHSNGYPRVSDVAVAAACSQPNVQRVVKGKLIGEPVHGVPKVRTRQSSL